MEQCDAFVIVRFKSLRESRLHRTQFGPKLTDNSTYDRELARSSLFDLREHNQGVLEDALGLDNKIQSWCYPLCPYSLHNRPQFSTLKTQSRRSPSLSFYNHRNKMHKINSKWNILPLKEMAETHLILIYGNYIHDTRNFVHTSVSLLTNKN